MPTSALDPESAGRRSSRILFAVNCSPVGDVIAGHGVQYHQYADDTQLHLAMRADNTAAGLSVLAACTSDVRIRIDYCNALLHGAPAATTHKLQRVQNNAARIVVEAPKRSDAKPLLRRLHWLPVKQRITYKTAVVTFKIRNTATPAYLNRHIQSSDCVQNLRSSGAPLLARASWKTDFAARGFRHSAPAVWNSLLKTVLDSSSLTLFKSRLKS